MQKLVTLMLVTVIALGGCATGMSGGDMAGMDHTAMATATPLAGTASGETVTNTQELTTTQPMTEVQAMTDTAMSGMDHGTMNIDPAQPFDAQFIDSMTAHHQGAIAMAEQALEQAEHPELKQMAEDVIAAQAQEIEEMATWRQAWYPDLPPTAGMGMGMGEMGISGDASKPFDQRFLEAMISHHQGAIDMAMMAQQTAEQEEIRMLADAIIAAQQAEIDQMKVWLNEWFGVGTTLSPYIAQLDSPVRGLSAQEVADLLAGRGMGYARVAELNHYPGPRHVLDLQTELNLSAAQRTAITAIFTQMQAQAQQLGQQIVSQEQRLSAAFASTAINETTLEAEVMALANLYGQLRIAHLRAHLQVVPLLNTEQIRVYNALRGYTGSQPSPAHEMNH